MAIVQSHVVPKNSGAAFEIKKGQRLRIAGRSIVDFVAFNLHDLSERFDQARTKTNQVKIFVSTGDILYSKRNNPMLTIVEDTFKEGRHDLQKGMCSRKRFQMVAEGQSKRVFAEGVDINPKKAEDIPDHGCWENLSDAREALEYLARRRAESIQYLPVHAHRSGDGNHVRHDDPPERRSPRRLQGRDGFARRGERLSGVRQGTGDSRGDLRRLRIGSNAKNPRNALEPV